MCLCGWFTTLLEFDLMRVHESVIDLVMGYAWAWVWLGMPWVTNLECTNSYVYRAGFGDCDHRRSPAGIAKE